MSKMDGSDGKVIASTSSVEDEFSWNRFWEDWREFCVERQDGPFFLGCLSLGTDQHGHKHFAVTSVKHAKHYLSEDLDLGWRRRPRSVRNGEWVIGMMANEGPIIFFNDDKKYPVQVLQWSDFEESDSERSLEQYLGQHKSGELSAKQHDPSIIGNKNVPGHIIITDGVIYVKGFFSYGMGVVKYSEVFKYDGDFLREVAACNQAMEMDHYGTDSIILLPPKWSSVDRHSVMDCEGWIPLTERQEGEASKPRDGSKGEAVETDSSASGQLTKTVTKNIVGSQVGEEMADAVGTLDLNSDQNEEEGFDSRLMPAKPMMPLPVPREITICGAVVVEELALKLGIRPNRLIADLMQLKVLVTINQRIEPEMAIKVAQKYGYKVKVEHARDAANKKPVLESINAGDEISQDNPTYSFGANVGGAIVAAGRSSKNEQHQTEAVNMPTDTTQGANANASVMSSEPTIMESTVAPSRVGAPPQIDDFQQREVSRDCGWDAEIEFLSAFTKYVDYCGFKYETADLVRLHTSVKCSMCTLLAGSPGTGKSSLAELYIRSIAGSPEKNEAERSWRQIFVNPAWMEPADLLGYETDNGFRHASSHLVEFIRRISERKNQPMGIVCFEEMNLACVEHYFSDFIQIISRGEGVIPGCKEDGKDLCVGRNFRVIGTCNSDETTRPLSPRFLSRCNTIELSDSFTTTKSLVRNLAEGILPEIKPFIGRAPITYKNFKDWYVSSNTRSIDVGIVNAILSLLEPKDGDESIMSYAGLNMSGRVVSDMFAYIRNRPPYAGEKPLSVELDRQKVTLDEFLAQGEKLTLAEPDRQKVALDEFLAQRVFFACKPTPGTIDGISALYEKVNKGFVFKVGDKEDQGTDTQLLQLPLAASLLKRRIDAYKKIIQ